MGTALIISSAKGGVGKTTVAVNLGVAMAELGRKTLIIDGSITTPDISLHLGIPFYIRTLNDYIRKEVDIEETVFEHKSGLKVIPTSIHPESSLEWLDTLKLKDVVEILKNEKDYSVIVDSSAGLSMTTTNVIKAADNIVIVTNPELASVINSYKTILAGRKLGIGASGIIINRVGRFKNEMTEEEIKNILDGLPVLGKIPEHHNVPTATKHSVSVLDMFPNSPVSEEFRKIACRITGEEYKEIGFWKKMFSFLS
jgi:septum site-determining protein MinD